MKPSIERPSSDVVGRIILSLLIVLIVGTPTWFTVGIKQVWGVDGFWQNLIAFGVGAYLFWFAQFVMGLIGLAFLVVLWSQYDEAL